MSETGANPSPADMKILLILCHPDKSSFNHAIAESSEKILKSLGHSIFYHDLYADGFDPVLRTEEIRRKASFDEMVQRQSRELAESDGIAVCHPNWWGGPPALLKGWIDRVFQIGVAYEFVGEEFEKKKQAPLLTGKRACVLATSDDPYSESSTALEVFWKEAVFGYCGVEQTVVRLFCGVRDSNIRTRRSWLKQTDHLLQDLFPSESGPGFQEKKRAESLS